MFWKSCGVKVSERSDTTKHTKKNRKKNTIIVASASRNQEPATQERALVVSMAECNALVSLVEREAPFLAFTADEKKIVCTLNNHELPARIDAVEAFVKYVKRAIGHASPARSSTASEDRA